MRREQVVGEGVERRDCGRNEQETAGDEGGDPPALCPASADSEGIDDGEREDGERRLEVRCPSGWVGSNDAVPYVATRGRSLMAKPGASNAQTRVRFPPPAFVRRVG
jgi:hypothetical protein